MFFMLFPALNHSERLLRLNQGIIQECGIVIGSMRVGGYAISQCIDFEREVFAVGQIF